MARRAPSSRPTVCPACDTPLDASLARDEAPSCPSCAQPLLPVQVAGFWRRTAAALIDGIILLLTAGLLNWALLRLLGLPALTGPASGLDVALRLLELNPMDLLVRFAPFFVMAGLYLGLFWTLTGRTPGQRLLRIRVVDASGHAPGPVVTLVRVVGHGLGLLACALGWLWAAFDLENRAWHDHMARTYVVRDS